MIYQNHPPAQTPKMEKQIKVGSSYALFFSEIEKNHKIYFTIIEEKNVFPIFF